MEMPRIYEYEDIITSYFPVFEGRLILFSLIALFLLMMTLVMLRFQLRLWRFNPTYPNSSSIIRILLRWRYLIILILFAIPILSFALSLFYMTFSKRPHVIQNYPTQDSYMVSAEEIVHVKFDLPLDRNTFKFNISPEIKGRVEYVKVHPKLQLVREIKFHPEESIPAGSKVVVYMTGIRGWLSDGKLHEYPIEYFAPKVPNVVTVSPANTEANVRPDKLIKVDFDAPIGNFINLTYEITPAIEYEIVSQNDPDHSQLIAPKENLKQDTTYTIKGYRTLRTYEIPTNKDLELSDTEEVFNISFTTASTPLLSSYTPNGATLVSPTTPISAVFSQNMNKDEVRNNFSITPPVEGEVSWSDEKTFLFKPAAPLQKDTEYEVRFAKGIMSEFFGKTTEDIAFKFKTYGKVRVSAFTPVNNTSGASPSGIAVSVQFDQPVDQASAQSKFAISPSVAGTFSWEGNTMRYNASGYAFSTTYTITIHPGVKSLEGIDSDESFKSVFTTRSQVFKLASFPWYLQQEGFTCNIAATRIALAYRGVYVSESNVKNWVGIGTDPNQDWVPGYGVHIGPISSYISQYRSVSVKTGWNVKDLVKEVQAGNPVILWWYNRYSTPAGAFTLPSGATGYNGMHSEVVYGFAGDPDNPTQIYVSDPWRGYLTYNTSTFVANWAYLNYTALVVR